MGYATISHVSARNPERTIGASSKPTASEVVGFIEDAAAIIDSILHAAGYVLPVVPPASGGIASSAWRVLEQANAVGAWYFTEWAAQASDKRSEAEDMWASMQKLLKTTQLNIPTDPAESRPRGPGVDSVPTPFFTRDMCL